MGLPETASEDFFASMANVKGPIETQQLQNWKIHWIHELISPQQQRISNKNRKKQKKFTTQNLL